MWVYNITFAYREDQSLESIAASDRFADVVKIITVSPPKMSG